MTALTRKAKPVKTMLSPGHIPGTVNNKEILFWTRVILMEEKAFPSVDDPDANVFLRSEVNPERNVRFNEFLEGRHFHPKIKTDAIFVLNIVFNCPQELIDMMFKNQRYYINTANIEKYLLTQGWIISRIRKTFTAIKTGLNNF